MAELFSLAVDARVLTGDTRGIGRYARAVLRRLAAREDLALTLLLPECFPWLRKGALARAIGSERFRVTTRLPQRTHLLWHPANGSFFSASGVPSVATIHDAVPFRFPNPDRVAGEREREPFLRSVRESTHFIAVSQFGASELTEALSIPNDRIEVIPHGVERSFTPGVPDALPGSLRAGAYLLFVGDPGTERRKNFSLLAQAHARAFPNGNPPLVVVGPRAAEYGASIYAGELRDDILGSENSALRSLYRGARALCVPSLHETFGMPGIEAMACGTPVLASQASCLPEIYGDAAVFSPPEDATAWSRELARIVNDDTFHSDLRERGLQRAAEYDWDRSAATHFALFQRVAAAARARA
ncbi:MAG: glycosyltransferase family 4 protein [Candidatus Eremiobacteraeota bacterium]|nr:glycosyltransferase family 4 protein [Candidatus Eremiobacteraeota bacterium]